MRAGWALRECLLHPFILELSTDLGAEGHPFILEMRSSDLGAEGHPFILEMRSSDLGAEGHSAMAEQGQCAI